MEELLLVKMTVFLSNLASLNCFHMSSLSLTLAIHLSWEPKPGAADELSELGLVPPRGYLKVK